KIMTTIPTLLFVALLVATVMLFGQTTNAESFMISGNNFVKDGQNFQIISGSFHYMRCHPSLWRDRLQKMKAAGLNTVQTYIAWNLHQPTPDTFDFATYNVTSFIEIAQEEGLLVVIRAGPYICGEWEFGGFPPWLLTLDPNIALRTSDQTYLNAVTDWFTVLLPILNTQLYTNGGPIIMMQVENEYGSYGSDKNYLNYLLSLYIKFFGEGRGDGSGVIFHSTDGSGSGYLYGSQIPGVYQTIDFGPTDDPQSNFDIQRKFVPTGPLMNSEYYTGWLTHWLDSSEARVDAKTVADGLYDILKLGASVNMYMMYGGSNFGFMNGVNGGDPGDFEITTQSYDYDSPISEAGDITPKYLAVRDAIVKWTNQPLGPVPNNSTHMAYGTIQLTQAASLFNNLQQLSPNPFITTGRPMMFEEMKLNYGFALYEADINTEYQSNSLSVMDLRDRATFYINNTNQGFVQRSSNSSINVQFTDGDTNQVRILLENQGRVNYGSYMHDPKGLGNGVLAGFEYLGPWNNYPLSLEDLSNIQWVESNEYNQGGEPTFYRGNITINSVNDIGETFLAFTGLGKGNLWINGFNVGRYWNVGPQRTMYVPSVLLHQGQNEVIIFETLESKVTSIDFVDEPFFN
ncbi:hypothetical protein SAMD00019534_108450, partial [Acytostelium subglobosum LB1]|uniref:hypothetical protein n=1 Tax=Acytostelium subglobosum LB1 TaxID=1410327 RepID=UPI000644A7BD